MLKFPHDSDASSSADLFDVLNRLAERWRQKELERQFLEWFNRDMTHPISQ